MIIRLHVPNSISIDPEEKISGIFYPICYVVAEVYVQYF